MSKPFDATLKTMLEASPAAWSRLAGIDARDVEIADADVSTVTGATDKALRLRDPDGIVHFDFQASPDAALPRRLHCYNGILEHRHELPVQSVIVLLRPEANLRVFTGHYERRFPGKEQP